MFDIQERIKKAEQLIKQAAIELIHKEVLSTSIEVINDQMRVTQAFSCIFGCWWTFYKIFLDKDGFITYSYFGDYDYPRSNELPRNINFEKAVLKILKENL